MGYFETTPGYVDCGKCGGWQILDKTIRNKAGWPVGPLNIVYCDYCDGKGEVKATETGPSARLKVATPWGAPVPKPEPVAPPKPVEALPIWDIDEPEPPKELSNPGWGDMPTKPKSGWDIHNG